MNVSTINPVWSINDLHNLYETLNANKSMLNIVDCSPSAPSISMPLDTIGESARNRFGRPYISGRPLLNCDKKRIIDMYNKGNRKITIARAIGITHSCVSKVIRRYEENGFIDNKGSSRTASCACPGEADAHDPAVCRHVKFRNEQKNNGNGLAQASIFFPSPKLTKKPFSIDWILSDQCNSKSPALRKIV